MKHKHIARMREAAMVAQDHTQDQGFTLSRHVDFVTDDPIVFCQAVSEEHPLHVTKFNSIEPGGVNISATFYSHENKYPFVNLTLKH